jgi:hypothetical protein
MTKSRFISRSSVLKATCSFGFSHTFTESEVSILTAEFQRTETISGSELPEGSPMYNYSSVLHETSHFAATLLFSKSLVSGEPEEFWSTSGFEVTAELESLIGGAKLTSVIGYFASIALLIATGMSFWVLSAHLEARKLKEKGIDDSEDSNNA